MICLFPSVGAMVSHLQNGKFYLICSHESYCGVAGIMCGTENKTLLHSIQNKLKYVLICTYSLLVGLCCYSPRGLV